MRHRFLSSSLFLTTAALMWSMAALGCRNNIIGPVTRDTVVVIDTGHVFVSALGRVVVNDRCDSTLDPSNVLVEIPELQLSTRTDSKGNYSFDRLPVRPLRVSYSRADLYSESSVLPPNGEPDGRFHFRTVQLYRPQNYTAKLIGDVKYVRFKTATYKDSIYLATDGEYYTRKVFADSVEDGNVTFTILCFDDQDRQTMAARPVLFVSRKQSIDPRDTSTYLFVVHAAQLERKVAAGYGIKPYEQIYVAVSSAPICTASYYLTEHPGLRCSATWGIQSP